MKKNLAATLALAFTLGIAGTAFAANPFVDVPAKHWSYDAVSKLAADGIVDGYGDGSFKGDKSMTRYEMATIVAKAMAKEEKANAEDKALIQKLSAEYSQELDNLGVRVSNLEKRMDNVTFDGKVRFRYDSEKVGDKSKEGNGQSYLDLFVNGKINDDWKIRAEIESSHSTDGTGITPASDAHSTSKIWAEGKVGATTLDIGKAPLFVGYGLVADTSLNGVQASFGDKLKTTVRYGNLAGDDGILFSGAIVPAPTATDPDAVAFGAGSHYAGVEFAYKASAATDLSAAYHRVNQTVLGEKQNTSIYELGFNSKIADNFTLNGQYAKGNPDKAVYDNVENKAYIAQVTYKNADPKVAKSFDIFAGYHKVGYGAEINTTNDYYDNAKGMHIGFDYVPFENSKFTAFYLNNKAINDDLRTDAVAGTKDKVYRAQVELYF
ncbi:S-layer homology domain-containing protein [Propionispora hippei]|uniref:S-layer homology domain-containing protein n=1 Tax=Propionispora hippei DSM 15287 TaxID=1123003 RepID=A0A1M6K4Z7_9FIRM|nr:S-layer homology domain-containing protein [Propionispora hippei]SHJ53991.1 S-layer homology domain-containing protein [Propionispora hippei DSM 15287]